MPEPTDWRAAVGVDTSEDVHVANPSEGRYVFYTEEVEAYIRTDRVVDLVAHR